MNKYDIYNKAIKVIDSCENIHHFKSAAKYVKLAKKTADDAMLINLMLERFLDRCMEVYKNWYKANHLCDKLLNNK